MDVTVTVEDRVLDQSFLVGLEATRARRMMASLMQKLGTQTIAELYAGEIAQASKAEVEWHTQSDGRFSESVAQAHVRRGSARAFVDWFVAGYGGPNAPAMQRAHPEHLGAILGADGRVGIVEVPGHGAHPAILHLRVLENWSGVPIPLDPAMPHRIMGRMESHDGRGIGYLLHQFADTDPGFEARLAVYWPAATPAEIVKGHALHLALEFNNWFHMYLSAPAHDGNLMPVAMMAGFSAVRESD